MYERPSERSKAERSSCWRTAGTVAPERSMPGRTRDQPQQNRRSGVVFRHSLLVHGYVPVVDVDRDGGAGQLQTLDGQIRYGRKVVTIDA
jgi:hypothetical protein